MYACHNGPRPFEGEETHLAQDGYDSERRPVWVPVRHVMSTDCMYDKRASDARCAGCKHITEAL